MIVSPSLWVGEPDPDEEFSEAATAAYAASLLEQGKTVRVPTKAVALETIKMCGASDEWVALTEARI